MAEMGKIIAAVRNNEEFDKAIKSKVETIFLLSSSIGELEYQVWKAKNAKKKLFIHIDLTSGLGKDKSGIEFAKNIGIDGIISTRASLIKAAYECGLKTVQRFFIVDSQSIDTTVEMLHNSKADYAEVMPGISPKIIEKLKKRVTLPIIAGGLIEATKEVETAIIAGASSVSTGCEQLWK